MSISFNFKTETDWLYVTASGKDDNFKEAFNYSEAVIEQAILNGSRRILCDGRDLEYKLSVIDTFELAENASARVKRPARIAIVCDGRFLRDGKFYETVATNRGLSVYVTSDYEDAIRWLKQ